MTPVEQNKFRALKHALAGSHYFVVDKSTAFKPCFLLYRRGFEGSTFVMSRKTLEPFIQAVAKIAHITINVSKVNDVVVEKTRPNVGTYWWQEL